MFALPLSLRKRLSVVCGDNVSKSEIVEFRGVLHILLISESYLEIIKIPLDGSPETHEVKAIFPIDACLCKSINKVEVYAITKEGVYVNGEIKFKEIQEGRIKSCGGEVVILSKNKFYHIKNNVLSKSLFWNFLSTITNFELGMVDQKVVVVYSARLYTTYISIFDLQGRTLLNKWETSREVFVDGNKLMVVDGGDLVVYRILKGAIEQYKRITLNMGEIDIRRVFLRDSLILTGRSGNSNFFYKDGVVFNVSSLITSIMNVGSTSIMNVGSTSIEYKKEYYCVSSDMLYCLPEDIPNIRLSGTEMIAMANILDNKFSPFVTRTFSYDHSKLSQEIEAASNINIDFDNLEFIKKGDLVLPVSIFPSTSRTTRNGVFMSLLAFQRFRIEVRKKICNVLGFIKKTGKGQEYLRLLEVFNRLKIKAYRAFEEINIRDIKMNKELLLRCLEVDFQEVDFLEGDEVYEILRGIERYKQGKEIQTLVAPSFFYRLFEENRDVERLVSLYKATGFYKASFLEIIKNSRKQIERVDLEDLVDDYKWYVEYLKGEYGRIRNPKKFEEYVYKDCRPRYLLQGLAFFYSMKDHRRVARLLYETKKLDLEVEEKYYQLVGDYVFIEDHQFVGI
ncbi:hypothetical protein NGRA_2613 [Nosema granulosis]|uniref:Uncharacterized protein n=1 Tax=Nosema granulosis TaxID=83296 RepID=A0A9P6GW97_9MICR|nr:hypothetical protein NGRA_2613 [Nosema granulosis]